MVVLQAWAACSSTSPPTEASIRSEAGQDLKQVRDTGRKDQPAETSNPGIVDPGPVFLDSCRQFNSQCAQSTDADCGKCQYRIRYKSQHCSPTSPCDNLFLFWAFAGCQGEQIEKALDQILDNNTDFVTVCLQPLYPGEVIPISLGAPERENLLVPLVFARLKGKPDLGVWSGKNLLMAGCSQGASRYPVVAARYQDDDNWLGSAKTAACFSDGVVSVSFQDRFLGEMLATGNGSCKARHKRLIEAYTRDSILAGHMCLNSPQHQCPCDPSHTVKTYPGDCGDGDCVAFDSIVDQQGENLALNSGVSADDFAVRNWKMISEGGAWTDSAERCDKDVVPREPFQVLCDALAADPDHRCTFVDKPENEHCAFFTTNLNATCVEWFRQL
jgi:hypothetical protein